MTNPFMTLNSTAEAISNIKIRCVDREDELHRCHVALVERRHNVLLYGSRGVGKTFLLRIIDDNIINNTSEVFTCSVNIASLRAYGGIDEVASFPRAVLLQLCASIWSKIIGKSYLDLRDRLEETGKELIVRSEQEITLQRIYVQLMREEFTSKSSLFNSVGITAGFNGEKSEKYQKKTKFTQIYSGPGCQDNKWGYTCYSLGCYFG